MTYSLRIEHNHGNTTYVKGIETWNDVLDYLKHKLDQWTIRVHIYKWSSNSRCLGEKCVTMGNLWDVVWNGTDKVLL
jgi:hypothetical protein